MTGKVYVLAAGAARRFGSDKRMARLASGSTVLDTTLLSLACVFESSNLVVVLRADRDEILAQQLDQQGYTTLCSTQAMYGMGGSVADAGKHMLTTLTDSEPLPWAAIALADMPHIHTSTLQALKQQAQALSQDPQQPWILRPASITAPGAAELQGLRGDTQISKRNGHPVFFSSQLFSELAGSAGQDGARKVVRDNRAHVHYLPTGDPGIFADIDTPDQLNPENTPEADP